MSFVDRRRGAPRLVTTLWVVLVAVPVALLVHQNVSLQGRLRETSAYAQQGIQQTKHNHELGVTNSTALQEQATLLRTILAREQASPAVSTTVTARLDLLEAEVLALCGRLKLTCR